MEFKVVLIEREDLINKIVYGSSGVMLNNKYVICTANVLLSVFNDYFSENWQSVRTGKLHSASHIANLPELRIIHNNGVDSSKYSIETGEVLAFYICEDLKLTVQQALQGWTIDSSENSKEVELILSLLVILKTIPTGNIPEFKDLLIRWWDIIKSKRVLQSDEILIKSTPFGNRVFLNSLSKGIVSNIVGENSSLIISDCPCTPGSEGSPVFKVDSKNDVAFGIVISSSCWWREEWTGLTLIVDMRSVLLEILENYHYKAKLKNIPHHLIASIESSLIHVYCGSTRGTAIIIDDRSGILLTNSHVISNESKINIYWRKERDSASLIYKTADNEVYDLAVLKCNNTTFLKRNNLRSVTISKETVRVGDEVICVGFAIFSKNVNNNNPTISKGCVTRYDPSIMSTSCCVNSGMSGGAVLNRKGELVGIIVCNTKIEKATYPRFNMAIPYIIIEKTMNGFLKSKDSSLLSNLSTDDPKVASFWKYLEAKL